MDQILTDEQLVRRRREGFGAIYNDFDGLRPSRDIYNILHVASCRTLKGANLAVPKYFTRDEREAVSWLIEHRGIEGHAWKRCGTCGGSPDEKPG
jgi:hypothetical protein